MAIEEMDGGLLGDLAITQLGLMVGGVGAVIFGIVVLFQWAFGNTIEDFQEAKNSGKSIVCQGLIKSYTVTPDKYKIEDNRIVIIRLIKNQKFYIGDCDIK